MYKRQAYTCLGSALQERGDIEEASRCYARAISIEPNDISPLLHLSRLREGMIPEHLTSLWLRNMSEIAEATTEPEQLFVKGNLLRHSGEIQEAFANYLLANALIHRDRPGQDGFPGNGEEELLTRLKHWQPRKPTARNSGKVKFLFILGPSRSGKSTIESIVGKSDRVRKGYEGWRGGYARRALERIHDSPGTFPFDHPSDIDARIAQYLFYHDAAELAGDGYRVLTCTNPFAIDVAHLVFDVLPSSYFIFVHRDAISTAAEIFATWYSDRMDHAYDPETALDHVNWYRKVADKLAAKMEGRSMVIDYGEFLGDTGSGVRSIEKLIDLDLDIEPGLSGFVGRDEKSAFHECFLNELERRGAR